MKHIILFSGKMQTGKNLAADYMEAIFKERGHTVQTDLYANDLKYGCVNDFKELGKVLKLIADDIEQAVFNMYPEAKFDNYAKNFNIALRELILIDDNFFENKNKISRVLLQTYGTEIFRNRVDYNYWAKQVRNRALDNNADVTIITDTRFPNEISVFDGIPIIKIRVERDTNIIDEHLSETALDSYKDWDYIIHNNSTIKNLRNEIISITDDILEKNN